MRGFRLFDHTDWKSKKDFHVLRCPVFTENIDSEEQKKRYTRPQMFSFPQKVSVKRKKQSLLFVMSPTIFSEALGFSLLSLHVNPALRLQSIFSLPTCDIPNLCGLRTHGSCFYFLFPLPQKQNFKEDICGFKLFPGF